jgi:hypothetical protein
MTQMHANPTHAPSRVITAAEAEGIAQAALDALDELEPLIAEETGELRDGRVRQALSLQPAKAEAAARYQRALQDLKANAIALGRYMPPSLALLRKRHETFAELMQLNMAVLGTTRTVSESLIRELAAEVGQGRQPQGYGARGQQTGAYRPQATPLAVSKKL